MVRILTSPLTSEAENIEEQSVENRGYPAGPRDGLAMFKGRVVWGIDKEGGQL